MLLALGGFVFWEIKGDDLIESQIVKEIHELGLSVDSLSVDYPGKALILHNVDLLPTAFGEKYEQVLDKYSDIHCKANAIEISGISWSKLKTTKKLIAQKITIKHFSTQMLIPLQKYLVDKPIDMIKAVSIDSVFVEVDSSIVYNSDKSKNELYSSIHSGEISLTGVEYQMSKKFSFENFSGYSAKLNTLKHFSEHFKASFESSELDTKDAYFTGVSIQSHSGNYIQAKIHELQIKDLQLDDIQNKKLSSNSIIIEGDKLELAESWFTNKIVLKDYGVNELNTDSLDISFSNLNIKHAKLNQYLAENISFKTDGIRLKSDSDYTLGNYRCKLNNAIRKNLNGLQETTIDEIQLTPDKAILSTVAIKPTQSRWRFSRNKQYVSNQYNLEVPRLVIEENLLDQWIENRSLHIKRLLVENLNASIYSNAAIPTSKNYKPILSEQILLFPIPFIIDELSVKSSYFSFELQALKRNDTGEITMSSTESNISNLTNISSRINKKPYLDIRLNTQFMGETSLSLNINMDYRGPNFPYTYSGTLGSVDFDKVNRMLEDLTANRIQKGEMDKMLFTVNANKYSSNGTMDFLYTNLKMEQVPERQFGHTDPFKLLVNGVILRRNNRADRNPRQGKIEVKRDVQKGMFLQIWEAIFDGIRSILAPRTIFNRGG